MNDDELITSVRESVTEVHSTTPVQQIVSRGRAVRARRRIPGLAGALVVAAGAALAVTALVPSGRQAGHQPAARLDAWTVAKLADGNISVTINQLRDPAGLQSRLRADGVPASVTFLSQQNPACHPYPGGTPTGPVPSASALLRAVFPVPYQHVPPRSKWISPPTSAARHHRQDTALIVIDPAALPSNAGVQIGAVFTAHSEGVRVPSVVYASPQCTGS